LNRRVGIYTVVLVILLGMTAYAYVDLQSKYVNLRDSYLKLMEDYADLAEEHEELAAKYERLLLEVNRTLEPSVSVTALNDGEYYETALRLINSANESVYIIMYAAKYDPDDPVDPANDLLGALAGAAHRGVRVCAILDDEVGYNEETLSYLQSAGVNATYDPKDVRTHSKIVIVDGYLVLIGSHNWTESGLAYNHETSVLVSSRQFAQLEIAYFNSVWAEAS